MNLPLAFMLVSTHSRLKAAGLIYESIKIILLGFNTQPPEGGWADLFA